MELRSRTKASREREMTVAVARTTKRRRRMVSRQGKTLKGKVDAEGGRREQGLASRESTGTEDIWSGLDWEEMSLATCDDEDEHPQQGRQWEDSALQEILQGDDRDPRWEVPTEILTEPPSPGVNPS